MGYGIALILYVLSGPTLIWLGISIRRNVQSARERFAGSVFIAAGVLLCGLTLELIVSGRLNDL